MSVKKNIDCFDKIKVADLSDKFKKLIKEGMSLQEQRDIGTKLALEYHQKLFNDLEGFKSKLGIKSKEKYASPDKSAIVKEITDRYNEELAKEQAAPAQEPAKTTVSDGGGGVGGIVPKDLNDGETIGNESGRNNIPDVNEVLDLIDSEEGRQGYRLYPDKGEKYDEDYHRFKNKKDAMAYAKEVHDVISSMPDNIPIYRAVSAKDVDLDPYGIGESWSFDLKAAREFGSHNGSNKIISGYVEKGNVDWDATTRAYHLFSGLGNSESEFEITVPSGNKITGVKVENLKDAKPRQGQHFFEQLQPAKTTVSDAEALPVGDAAKPPEPPAEPPQAKAEEGGGQRPPGEPIAPKEVTEGEIAQGITHAANEVRRKDRKLADYQRQPETFEQWNNEAEQKLKDGYDVDKLMDRIEAGHDPTPVENAIRKIYVATLDAEILKNPTDELLARQKRFIEVGDLANSRAGRNLASLKGVGSPLESISDFYVARMEALGSHKLTEQQKRETQQVFEAVQKADANAEKVLQEYAEEIAKLKAENELLRHKKAAGKPTKPKTGEDFKKERQSYREELKKAREKHEQWLKDQNIKKSGGGFTLTTEMAKIIAKIAKSYVDEGIVRLEDVIQKALDEIKDIFPEVDSMDIRDVLAGEYNEARPTRDELAAKWRDLKDEAYYINKLEKLLSGEEPKKEKEKIKRNQRITELQDKIAAFRRGEKEADKFYGDEAPIDYKKLEALRKKNEAEAEKTRERIKAGDFAPKKPVPFLEDPELQKKFPQKYKEVLDAIHKREEARHEFDIALLKDQMSKRTFFKKYGIDLTGDIIGTTKALVTGIDASGIGIQNLKAMVAHPRSAMIALPISFTDFVSAQNQQRWLTSVHSSKLYPLAQKAGLDITEPQSLKASEREEIFTHNLLDRAIKYKGKKYVISKYITKPFERIFVGLGNRMRWNLWQRGVAKLQEQGYTWENHPEEYTSLAKVLNTETGRGKLHPQVDKAFNLISAGIWSPRLMASRMNILGIGDLGNLIAGGKKGYYGGLTPKMRLYALKDLAKFITFGTMFMGLAGLTFADDVDFDPNSSTFGTFLVNGKRYNIWGGFTQYVRLIATYIAGGEKKSDGTFTKTAPADKTLRFLWSKTTPAVGTGISLMRKGQRDYMGQPVTPMGALENLTIPLSIRGIVKGIKEEGGGSVLWTGVPSFIGTNVSYQSDFDDKKTPQTKPERQKPERPKREKRE